MSKLSSFIKSLYDPPHQRCLILGLDGAGKTALLYRLKIGLFVTTIPTIGFNCEEVPVGRDVVTFWDVGGCDMMRPLIRHYMTPGHSILFLVNAPECIADHTRREDTLRELKFQVTEASQLGLVFAGIAFSKSDLVSTSQSGTLRQCVKDVMEGIFPAGAGTEGCAGGRWYEIFDVGVSSLTGRGLELMVTRLVAGINRGHTRDKATPGVEMSQLRISMEASGGEVTKPADKVGAKSKDYVNVHDPYVNSTPEAFFEMMESGELMQWDHRAHVRGGFYVLIKCLGSGLGLWDAVDDFLGMLDKMLATDAARAQIEGTERRFRNTVHRTMTTFYMHSIHMSILKFMDFRNPPRVPQHTEFEAFLAPNTHLLSSRLWAEYYSRELLFSPSAKEAWRLPDLKPLPIYFCSPGNTPPSTNPPPTTDTDPDQSIKRFAFVTLKRAKSTNSRRGKVVKDALQALHRHTIHLRASGFTSVNPYSETKAYFYIQIIHAAMQGLGSSVDITRLSFDSFAAIFPELVGGGRGREIWREYYRPTVWESVGARAEFVPPSLKPLPNVIPPAGANGAAVVGGAAAIQGGWRSISEVELMLAGYWATSEMQDPSAMLRSHGGMIWWYFSALWTVKRAAAPLGAAARVLVRDHLLRKESSRGVTEKSFWIHIILLRLERFDPVADGGAKEEGKGCVWDRELCLSDARKFLAGNRDLAGEDLWMAYYSPETWHSGDAVGQFVPPDVRPLEGAY